MRAQLLEDINPESPVRMVALDKVLSIISEEDALIVELLKEASFGEGIMLGGEQRLLTKLRDRIQSLS